MTQQQVTKHVASKLKACRNCMGTSFEVLCIGVNPDDRWMVAIALRDLIEAGKATFKTVRAFDRCGNAEDVTMYEKRFT